MLKKLEISIETDPRIRLHPGGFYLHEAPDIPAHKLYCLWPWEADGNAEFPDLAIESAIWMLNCIPVGPRWCEELECCGFTRNLPADFVYSYPAQFGRYPYVLRVYFHENHDYLLFETGPRS